MPCWLMSAPVKCWRWLTVRPTTRITLPVPQKMRCVTGQLPTCSNGSTVKPMVVMTALQRGIVNENTVLNTIPYRINGHEIKDVARYSELTLTGVLQKSSNVGVSKLALAMPSSALVETYSRFGLGKATNLGLVGERSGLYPQNNGGLT